LIQRWSAVAALQAVPLRDDRCSPVLEVTLGELDRSDAESIPETKE
jgi:hypothetical protein